ncbi:MAG: hypothetical protein QOE60_504 [Thermoleophilaceae bacterium]|jgi:putative sugar O-methyltransferase|nr:hypothetical protein [Thermoleophilaceae bacterium]
MTLDERIRMMGTEMESAPQITQPSKFWQDLNAINLQQLERRGFDQFKRTINGNYFQWQTTTPRDPQFRMLLVQLARHPTLHPLFARLAPGAYLDTRVADPFRSPLRRRTHAWFIASLWEYVQRRDRHGLTRRLREPALGNPLVIEYRGRKITQDVCNSALEMLAILDALPGHRPPDNGILEIGGGYGRLAWAFLECFPSVRYLMVDIPPALAVAERYLSLVYPHRPRFEFRHFDSYEDVRQEFEDSQILFLTPNQLELIPTPSAGLCINVSSLHEMSPPQIEHYLRTIDAHSNGFFYTKQWLRSMNPHDEVIIRREDYEIPATWRSVFDRPHPVQTNFFEALYATRDA